MKLAGVIFLATTFAASLCYLRKLGVEAQVTPSYAVSFPMKDKPRVIHGIGYVEPKGDLRGLAFRSFGVIAECNAEAGQHFLSGDVLATLNQDDALAAVEVASRGLDLACAERDKIVAGAHPALIEAAHHRVRQLQESLQYLKGAHAREVLLSNKNASTQDKLELAGMSLRQTEEELREAEAKLRHLKTITRSEEMALSNAQVALAEARVREAKVGLERTELRAPTDGTVLEIVKRPGEAVLQLDPTPVLVFADLSELQVRAEIDERYANEIVVGASAMVKGRNLGGREILGEVTRIQPLMGKKLLFNREASEKKDIDVLQIFVQTDEPLDVPVGLKVDVVISTEVE